MSKEKFQKKIFWKISGPILFVLEIPGDFFQKPVDIVESENSHFCNLIFLNFKNEKIFVTFLVKIIMEKILTMIKG